MSRSKASLANALTSLGLNIVTGILGFIITRNIIKTYGSDTNGIIVTAAQLVYFLLILEAGFTIPANVALVKAFNKKEINKIAQITEAINIKFKKIGTLFLFSCVALSLIYAYLIKSNVSYETKLSIFLMAAVPAFSSLTFGTKYKLLLQSDNNEKIINYINITISIFSSIAILVVLKIEIGIIEIRGLTMLAGLATTYSIIAIAKKKYQSILSLKNPVEKIKLQGENEVLIQKIVGVTYFTFPTLYISYFIGTTEASVYAIYNGIFILLKSIINSIANAPRFAISATIHESGAKSQKILNLYNEYELSIIIFVSIFATTSFIGLPYFITLYASDFKDFTTYSRSELSVLFCIIFFIECIHLPSGIIINFGGQFEAGKKIQIAACIFQSTSLILLGSIYHLNGVLYSILLTAAIIAILEIYHVRKIFLLEGELKFILKAITANLLLGILITILFGQYKLNIENFIDFFIAMLIIFMATTIVICTANLFLNRKIINSILYRVRHLL